MQCFCVAVSTLVSCLLVEVQLCHRNGRWINKIVDKGINQ